LDLLGTWDLSLYFLKIALGVNFLDRWSRFLDMDEARSEVADCFKKPSGYSEALPRES